MKSEPTITITTITTLVSAVFVLLVAFGLDISSDQQTAILAIIGSVYPVVTALWVRKSVYAPDTVQQIKATEYNAGHRAGINAANGVR